MTTDDKELSLLSIHEGQVTFNNQQKTALIDVLRVKHATDADLAVFFHLCRQRDLDPFLRQIYMIARQEWDKDAQQKVWRQTFQTGIDGFRTIASRRAAKLRVPLSYEPTIYVGGDGVGHEYWVSDEPPAAVKVTVKLGDAPFPYVARYTDYAVMTDEYEPDTYENGKKVKGKKTGRKVPSGMWATRPTGQLEKCAEAGALRRACPEDLGGIYEFSELEHQDEAITTLVDDGAATAAKPKAKGTNWMNKVQRAKTTGDLGRIWTDSKAAGQRTPELERAITEKGARLQAKEPKSEEPKSEEPLVSKRAGEVVVEPGTPETEALADEAERGYDPDRIQPVVHASDDWSDPNAGTACGLDHLDADAAGGIVAGADSMVQVTCPGCRTALGLDEDEEGQ